MSESHKNTKPKFPSKRSPTAVTTRHLRDLIPSFLKGVETLHKERPDLIVAAWPEVIGKEGAKMTQALHFQDGILTVRVKNSTLYSLLNQHDKPRILKNLREKFSQSVIKTVHFQLG